jgi:hypothetical protein
MLWNRIDDEWVADATVHGGRARFINHSCDPNCESRIFSMDGTRKIGIYAKRAIQRGEELCYDYKVREGRGPVGLCLLGWVVHVPGTAGVVCLAHVCSHTHPLRQLRHFCALQCVLYDTHEDCDSFQMYTFLC